MFQQLLECCNCLHVSIVGNNKDIVSTFSAHALKMPKLYKSLQKPANSWSKYQFPWFQNPSKHQHFIFSLSSKNKDILKGELLLSHVDVLGCHVDALSCHVGTAGKEVVCFKL
jgi:hypothetical protein